jgi:branched-chain amino acid transport system permease protein
VFINKSNNNSSVVEPVKASRSWSLIRYGVAVFFIIIGLLLPLFVRNPYFMSVLILLYMMGYLSTTWGIIGQTGQLSFGHSAFVGLGGYTSTILYVQMNLSPWFGMIAGGVMAVLFGVIIGIPTLRLRGVYFALATLAFAAILQIVAKTTLQIGPIVIGASPGIQMNLINGGDAPAVFQFLGKKGYYYVIFAMLIGVLFLSYMFNRARIGYYWTAIRNDEDAAESLGISVSRYRITGFLLSCFLTGMGGVFYAQYLLAVDPRTILGLSLSTEIAVMGIVGGWQSVFGPLIGAAVLVPINQILRARLYNVPQLTTVIYGLILVLFMLFLPKGINGLIVKGISKLKVRLNRPVISKQSGEVKGNSSSDEKEIRQREE